MARSFCQRSRTSRDMLFFFCTFGATKFDLDADSQTRFAWIPVPLSAVPSRVRVFHAFPLMFRPSVSLPIFSSIVGSWSNARAKSDQWSTKTRNPLFIQILSKARINLRALWWSCTVIGLCSFKILEGQSHCEAAFSLFRMGFTDVSLARLSICFCRTEASMNNLLAWLHRW